MILLAASLALAAAGSGQVPLQDSGVVEEIEVRRVPWPVLVEALPGAEEGRCRALTVGDVLVEEEGQPARVVAVDQGNIPTLYSIVVDTSGSMSDFLLAIGEGLAEFVGALGARERAMIASLDDDFVLLTPPTADRDALLAAARHLRWGTDTLIRESLHDLLLFLESRPGRKVLFVVTDGGDSQVVRQLPWEKVVDAASAIPDLTVFVVGVASSRSWQYTLGLRQIAIESGGLFHEVVDGADVGDALLHLRRRVRREATIVYEPPAVAANGSSRRRVRVEPADGVPCRLTSYRATRALYSAGARDVARRAVRWNFGDVELPACAAQIDGGRWSGFSAVENLVDPGPLYDRARWRGERRLSARMRMSPETGARALGLWLMEASALREAPLSASEIAWLLVVERGAVDCLVDAAGGFGPLVAHGRTFLEARPELAQRVAEIDPSWDRFAWDVLPQAASLEDARTEALAAWLGDVPAREFLDELQALGAGAILRTGNATPDAAAALGAAWPRLADAFGAANAAGVVALLVPVLAPDGEAIGYWRIALSRPQYAGPPGEPPSHEPLVLAAARWLVAAEGIAAALPVGWAIEQASQAGSRGEATLRLAAPDGGALVVVTRFARGSRLEPSCVAVSANPVIASQAMAAAQRLAAALEAAGRLCTAE